MRKALLKIRWKLLLGVFKLRRGVNRLLGKRRLDYAPHQLYLITDTLREYETRARSVRKEPKTVAWIEAHGGPETVFYDVGANVGAYTLIAAARGARAVAFEPALQNSYKLRVNARANGLENHITIVPLMLAAANGATFSEVPEGSFGKTHSFSLAHPSVTGEPYLALTLDTAIELFSLPSPTMLKIDVDGAEEEVLQGAVRVLADPALTTVLIETEERLRVAVCAMLERENFALVDEDVRTPTVQNLIFVRRRLGTVA